MGDGESRRSDVKHHQREVALARRADRQLGVVTREQLDELGFTRTQIDRRVAQGRLHRLFHNVYAVGRRQVVDRARLLAAQLSLGPASFLSHRTAAAAWGLRAVNVRRIELTIPGTGGRVRDGLTIHRSKVPPHPADVRTTGGLRVSSIPRMLVELAPVEAPNELGRLVTVAVQKRLLRPDAHDGRAAIEAALARHHGFPAMRRLRSVLDAYLRTESHKSQLELAFDRLLVQHPDIPEPTRNIHIDGWEIDRFWPAHNLAVELDGRPYHMAVREMERDRIKDAALQRLGIVPLRFTDFRVEHDVAGMLGDLRHFLGIG